MVENLVVEKLREILCDGNAVIKLSDTLVSDLGIVSDDLSFIFIPELEEQLGIKASNEDWLMVNTVGDAIDLLLTLSNSDEK